MTVHFKGVAKSILEESKWNILDNESWWWNEKVENIYHQNDKKSF